MPTRIQVIVDGAVTRLRFETENGIHILSGQTRRELARAIQVVNRDANCRVVVFEAQGRTFLAGAELTELQALTEQTAEVYALGGQELMNSIAKLKPLTICAIHAACAGGGCELALACDMRPAAAGAKVGLPEVGLGLIPGWGGTVRATKLLGAATARRIILTGTLFPAAEALQLGLVDSVFPNESFSSAVDALITHLLTRGPAAVQRAKKMINQLSTRDFKKAFRREAKQFAACYATGEPVEGIRAFLEKRTPVWPAPAIKAISDITIDETPKVEHE
ncbi:MAG: Enoyl-CoA hydratase/isomerase [Planctomycetaceae bacterium]|nr:Enoyl-CoA hydratase/isomerase [Planctomycetaceae bacterium]